MGKEGVADIHLEHRDAAAQIGQQLSRRNFLAVNLDGEIVGLPADGVGSVKRAGGINKKSGAGKFAVLIDGVNFYDRFGAALENLS